MKRLYILTFVIFATILSSCFKDLDTVPLDPLEITSGVIFDDPSNYRKVLAKLYAGLALSGQEGPSGIPDISGIDEGFGQYLRGFWYHQELTTDEALIGWNDQTIADFHNQSWGAGDGFIFAFYSRIFYQISLCNEFLRETTNEKLNSRGVGGALRTEVEGYRAEARFLRALSYWHALDLFRSPPFVTENDPIGAFFPQQTNPNDLFAYIESELLAIENELPAPRTNEYARADRAAVWTLLAKLYLNAEVYTGQDRYAQCAEICERIINAGYTMEPVYQHLFLADNDRSNEIIFPVAFDGISTRTWGGTTFIVNASIGGNMNPSEFGVAGGWGGLRTTREFFNLFPDEGGGVVAERNPGQTASYPKRFVVGPYQGGNPSNTNALSSPMRNNIFEGHEYFSEPGTQIQFMAVLAPQAPRFGDNGSGMLVSGGAPITVTEAGLHFIEVDWNTLTYRIEKREWQISGTGVANGPYEMTWDPELNGLKATVEMSGSAFSFEDRLSGIRLGDNTGSGILSYNSNPISKITTSGSYDIILFANQPDYSYQINSRSFDRRPFFHTSGQSIDIDDIAIFTQGIAVRKFKNVRSDGTPGSNATHVDTDFPMFRLGDVYLMAAEAYFRSGNSGQAAEHFNKVRERAYQGGAANITPSELTLDLLIDERGRELYWECHRRTDLIRFGKFSDTDYLWQWKGGVREGRSVPSYRDVFPLPSADINANPNLIQNTGY
jgi:hypothetical protein